jgi:hypothetical protein
MTPEKPRGRPDHLCPIPEPNPKENAFEPNPNDQPRNPDLQLERPTGATTSKDSTMTTRIPVIDPAEIAHIELTHLADLHPDQVESLIGSNPIDDLAWHLPLIEGYPGEVQGALVPHAVAWAFLEAGARVAWATLIPSPAAQKRQARHVEQGDQFYRLYMRASAGRAEAWAELAKVTAELSRAKAELAELKAERKANAVDALQQAILETLRTMSSAWPAGEIPSTWLWAAMVDRGAVATVRPGRAADGEPHRYYRAKMALVNAGVIAEAKGFVRLVDVDAKARAKEFEPTFMD